MSQSSRQRLGILLSGRGSNFEAIARNVLSGRLDCEIGFVFSNKPEAPGLAAARQLGVDAKRSIVVEDAIAGVQAGKRGGFGLVIGIARTGNGDALQKEGASLVVTDLEELFPPRA